MDMQFPFKSGSSGLRTRLTRVNLSSLRNKIILLTLTAVFLSTLSIATILYLFIGQFAQDAAIERLASETRLVAQRFKSSYDQMKDDAQALSDTQSISRIISSRANAGMEPLERSATSVWGTHLGTIFQSVMETRRNYSQVSYVDADGRELVSVNRTGFGPRAVLVSDLQDVSDAPYFKAGIKLGKGEVYFSDLTYSRESASPDATLFPTVHAVASIQSETGTNVGMIVINANYEEMLRGAFPLIAPHETTLVVNNFGDYMQSNADGSIGPLQFHDKYTEPPPAYVSDILQTNRDEMVFKAGGHSAYFVRLKVDPSYPGAFPGVVVSLPESILLAPVHQLLTISMLSGALLVAICLVVAFFFARRFMAPLNEMAKRVSHTSAPLSFEGLPVERRDEVGELARAFVQQARALAESEARARAVIDNAFDCFLTVHSNGLVETCNPSCERIFGYPAAEIVGQDISVFFPDYFTKDAPLRRKFVNSQSQTLEVSGMRKNGSRFPAELSTSSSEVGGVTIRSLIIRDATERKQMEAMKDEFISTVNHELRTPLTSIQGALGILIAKCDSRADPKEKMLLSNSYESCQRLSRLVNDILDAEKILRGKIDYTFETVEICQLTTHIAEDQVPFAENYGVRIETRMPDFEIFARIDTDRFNQALINIICNAAKFSGEAKRIIVCAERLDNGGGRISVQDFGPGIPQEFRARIFGKFAQADGSSTRKAGGSGLGLSITKSIVEAFGGIIGFDSEEGKGTTFYFELPPVILGARSA